MTRALLAIMGFLAAAAPAWPKAPARAVLSEIRYIGIGQIPARDLERVLPFSVGEAWDPSGVEAAVQAMEGYLAKRGFYNARVEARAAFMDETHAMLHFHIQEGPPCIISEVSATDPTGITGKANIQRFKGAVLERIGLKAGDRYDEEVLGDRLRALRNYLVKEDYILADTDNVRLQFSPDQSSVKVNVAIRYGERVSFGFDGNEVFSRGELVEFINQLKETDLGKDYLGVITRRLADEYKNKAYGNVQIQHEFSDTSSGKRVTFRISEGRRVRLSAVSIEGLSPENIKDARETFLSSSSRLVQRDYYVERDVERGLQAVIEMLKSRGYLSAKLVSKSVIVGKTKGSVAVTAQFHEGERTFIDSVVIEGGDFFGDETILAKLELKVGDPFNPYRFEETLQRLRADYVAEGFLESKVAPNPDDIVTFGNHNRRVSVKIAIDAGPRFKVGETRVEGLTKTKPYIVNREIDIKKGDWWLSKDAYALEDSLKRLGIFAEVRVKPAPSALGPEYRDLLIDLKEGEPGVIEFGPGFRSDLGVRGFARFAYGNLFGRNHIVTLSGDVNRRIGGQFPYQFIEYGLQTTFVNPRIFSSRNALTVGLSLSKRQFIDFNAAQNQAFITLDRKLFIPQLLGRLTYKLERVRQFGAPDFRDNQTLTIGSVSPTLVFDTRDSPFTATKGQISQVSYEYAAPELAKLSPEASSAVGYEKWTASTHFYLPVTKDIVWSNVVGGGYIRNMGANAIPLIKAFRLGGYASIRGFKEDSINLDQSILLGGLVYLNFRTQVDLPLVGDLKIAPFLDAGNLYQKEGNGDILFNGNPFLRTGAGAGLHYMTPIGPINFDYGIKLNRRSNESSGQFHFSVGII